MTTEFNRSALRRLTNRSSVPFFANSALLADAWAIATLSLVVVGMNSDEDGNWIALEAATRNLVVLLHVRKSAPGNVVQEIAKDADEVSHADALAETRNAQ